MVVKSLAEVCGISMGIPLELKEGTERLTEQRWSYSEEEQLDLQKKKPKKKEEEESCSGIVCARKCLALPLFINDFLLCPTKIHAIC
jgi:hypothetical protein